MSDKQMLVGQPLILPQLETARIRLRLLTPEDAPALYRVFSDPEAMRYYDVEPFTQAAQADELVTFFAKRQMTGTGCRWGIELKSNTGSTRDEIRPMMPSEVASNVPGESRELVDRELHASDAGATRRTTGLVGTIGFNRFERTAARRTVLGYDLVRDVWGRGLATEAVRAVIEYGFSELGLNRIEAYTEPENVASQRVLEKAGFIREGHLREFAFYRGAARDQVCFAILARDDRGAPQSAMVGT